MDWRRALLLAVVVIGLSMLSPEVRAVAADVLARAHDSFVVVFVDAATFVRGCF